MKKPLVVTGTRTRNKWKEVLEEEEKYEDHKAKKRTYKDKRVGSGKNPDRHKPEKKKEDRHKVQVCGDCGGTFTRGSDLKYHREVARNSCGKEVKKTFNQHLL